MDILRLMTTENHISNIMVIYSNEIKGEPTFNDAEHNLSIGKDTTQRNLTI